MTGGTDWIRIFIDHLRINQGSSLHTIQAYARDLRQFGDYLKTGKTEMKDAIEADLEGFMGWLRERGQKPASIARKISALKHFYRFLLSEKAIEEDPSLFIEARVTARRLPKALDAENLNRLLEASDEGLDYSGNLATALKIRDRAMIYLLYATGVRVSELVSISVSQMDVEAGYVRVMGKRSKERIVPFAPIAGKYIHEYLHTARPLLEPETDVLFAGKTGSPLTRQGFWKTLGKLAIKAGIPANLHPHMLRHTFATDLLKSGMNLRSLQMLLGHSDLQTTQIYTHVAPEKHSEVIERHHPRAGSRKKP